MRCVAQRVPEAYVTVDGRETETIPSFDGGVHTVDVLMGGREED